MFMVMDIGFIGQLVDSMSDAVLRLEGSIAEGKKDEANRLRIFIFDLYKQIAVAMGVKNV